jgi:hypothetical protein
MTELLPLHIPAQAEAVATDRRPGFSRRTGPGGRQGRVGLFAQLPVHRLYRVIEAGQYPVQTAWQGLRAKDRLMWSQL